MATTNLTYVDVAGLSVNGTPAVPSGAVTTALDALDVSAGLSVNGAPVLGSPALPAGMTPTRFGWLSLKSAPTLRGVPIGG